jgi:hypothetical protein
MSQAADDAELNTADDEAALMRPPPKPGMVTRGQFAGSFLFQESSRFDFDATDGAAVEAAYVFRASRPIR